jgi:hypothetical protein
MITWIKNALRWIRVVSAGLEAGVNEYEKDAKSDKQTDKPKE